MTSRFLLSGNLLQEPPFRRLLIWSAVVHVSLTLFLTLARSPWFVPLAPEPVFVELVSLPEPAVAPTPPRQAVAPPPPRQVVDEPVVIPKKAKPEPPPKPKAVVPPQPKAEAQPKPEVKPEPKAEVKPETPPPSASDLLDQIRKRVEHDPAKQTAKVGPTGGRGRFDPEMAAYKRRLKGMIYGNWVGVRAFDPNLKVSVQVHVNAGGSVDSIRVVKPSGNRYFDDTAERAIRKSEPFPPPPRGDLMLTVDFDPRESL